MSVNETMPQRFHKSWHFLNGSNNKPLEGLSDVFNNYHLDEMIRELQLWESLALINDESVYGEGPAREDLMDFIDQLQRLIEALHVLYRSKTPGRESTPKNLPGSAANTKPGPYESAMLSADEKENPMLVIRQFSETFRKSYVRVELLDMLDSVITYEGHKEVNRFNLVTFYENFYFLAGLAFRIIKNKKLAKSLEKKM